MTTLPSTKSSAFLARPMYTIVWSLPLVFLVFSMYFGSALTRDMTRKMIGSTEN
jgi:hypothetical protein